MGARRDDRKLAHRMINGVRTKLRTADPLRVPTEYGIPLPRLNESCFIVPWAAGIPFVISPAPNQPEPGDPGLFHLRSGHWEVQKVPFLVSRVAFPCLQDGADIVMLIAFIHHFLTIDLGEHEIGVGERILRG